MSGCISAARSRPVIGWDAGSVVLPSSTCCDRSAAAAAGTTICPPGKIDPAISCVRPFAEPGTTRARAMTMTASRSVLERFFEELRTVRARSQDPRAIVVQVQPLVRQLAITKCWLEAKHYECDPEQGFGAHLLHEEPDHTLAVFVGSWLPGRGAPPHNHGTWAVVAGVEGAERNTFWVRLDDGARPGYAEIRKQREQVLGPGDAVTFQPDTIHSVINETDRVSLSLHVYGTHINHTHRFQFDPDRSSARAYMIKVDAPSGHPTPGH